jgi:hypothetical protein
VLLAILQEGGEMTDKALWIGRVDGAMVVRVDDVLALLRSEYDLANGVAKKMEAQLAQKGYSTPADMRDRAMTGTLCAGAAGALEKIIGSLEGTVADEVKAADANAMVNADCLLRTLRSAWHDVDDKSKKAVGESAWVRASEVEKQKELMTQALVLSSAATTYDQVIKLVEQMVGRGSSGRGA